MLLMGRFAFFGYEALEIWCASAPAHLSVNSPHFTRVAGATTRLDSAVLRWTAFKGLAVAYPTAWGKGNACEPL